MGCNQATVLSIKVQSNSGNLSPLHLASANIHTSDASRIQIVSSGSQAHQILRLPNQ